MTTQVIDLTLEPGQNIDLTLEPGQNVDLILSGTAVIDLVLQTSDIIDLVLEGSEVIDLVVSIDGAPGPQGPPGISDFAIVKRIANTLLSGHRLVTPLNNGKVFYADCTKIKDLNRPIWLTTSAWLAGELAELISFGTVDEDSWAWIPGKAIYLGKNGLLTQKIPNGNNSDFMVQVAVAETPTRIFYNPTEPLLWVGNLSGIYSDIYSDVYGNIISVDDPPDSGPGYSDIYSDVYGNAIIVDEPPASAPGYSDIYSDIYGVLVDAEDEIGYSDVYSDIYSGARTSRYSNIYTNQY